MNTQELILYCGRAAIFAAAISGLWLLWYWMKRRKDARLAEQDFWLHFAGVFYLAALLQITIIRGADTIWYFWQIPHGGPEAMQLVPFHTILWAWKAGGNYFFYQVLGNIAWFVPLGALGPSIWKQLRHFWVTAVFGALLSLCIELSQWLLETGNTDIDDLLLNTAGAALGWLLWALAAALHRRKSQKRK